MARYRRRYDEEDRHPPRPERRRRIRPGFVEDHEFGGRGWPAEDGPPGFEWYEYDDELRAVSPYDEAFEAPPGWRRRRAQRAFRGPERTRPRPDRGHELEDAGAGPLSDREVRDAVEESLFQDPWLDPERIRVDVSGGVVRLSGEVDDFLQARFAWDDAWESAGVRGVINHLTVRSDEPHDRLGVPQTGGGS